MTCVMLGVLVRAGYEIHRAEDARRMATRRPPGSAASGVVTDHASAELPLAARKRIEPTLEKVHA
jgi:cell division protein FtsW